MDGILSSDPVHLLVLNVSAPCLTLHGQFLGVGKVNLDLLRAGLVGRRCVHDKRGQVRSVEGSA
jgi:hypothetical protein